MIGLFIVPAAIIYFVREAKKRAQPQVKWAFIAFVSFIIPQPILFWIVAPLFNLLIGATSKNLANIQMLAGVVGVLVGFYLLLLARSRLHKKPRIGRELNDLKYWRLAFLILLILGILAISNNELINQIIPTESWVGGAAESSMNPVQIIRLIIFVIEFFSSFEDIFNDEDDDNAREYVFGNDCSVLNGNSNNTLITKIGTMIDGPTGDDDERAILKILNCLPCDRVSEIVGRIGRRNLKDEFHGREFDLLMVRLQECGLATFRQWDDDATRIFIKDSDCATLNSLTNAEINQLLKNLFEGATLDADEKRIIKLMRCLPCSRRKEIMQMKGSRYRRFDNNVHGSEWDTLKPLLKC